MLVSRSPVVLFVLVVLVGGGMTVSLVNNDANPVTSPDGPARFATDGANNAFSYECPPGGSTRADGLCVGSIADPSASEQEPFIAIHPDNAQIMALSTNRGDPINQASSLIMGPTLFPPASQTLRITTDGGGTWTWIELPPVAHPNSESAQPNIDPTIAFDSSGTLHVGGMLIVPGPATSGLGNVLYYAATDDLGASWKNAQTVGPLGGGVDRPWLSVLPDGLITMTAAGHGGIVAWSADAGAAWTFEVGPEAGFANCSPPGPMVSSDVPLFSCIYKPDASQAEARVYTFDPDTASFALRSAVSFARTGSLSDQWWSHLVTSADGNLVLMAQRLDVGLEAPAAYSTWLQRSTDDGRTWSQPVRVQDALTVDETWGFSAYYWIEADPWNNVHLLMVGCRQDTSPAVQPEPTTCPLGGGTEEHAHAVFNAVTLDLVQERSLGSPIPSDQIGTEIQGGPAIGDHFGGMAFGPNEGILIWTRYQAPVSYVSTHNGVMIGLEYTMVSPVGPS